MAARVSRIKAGWAVMNDGRLVGVYATNREAWRVADNINNEYQSRAEDTSDWIAGKNRQ